MSLHDQSAATVWLTVVVAIVIAFIVGGIVVGPMIADFREHRRS